MILLKQVNIVVVLAVTVLGGILYAAPGGPGGRGPGGPGPGGPGGFGHGGYHDGHGPFISVVIGAPRIRPVIICPPRRVYVEPVVVVSPPPVVVAPASTVVVASAPAREQVIVWVTNSNGSRTPVTLVKLYEPAGYYAGPKGEYYACLPTDEQLRPMYGLNLPAVPAVTTTITVWITNENGSKTPVTLTPANGGYVGPSGEFYSTLPSEQQLKAVYGLPSQTVKSESTVVWITSGSKQIPIVLVKEGNEYVGPKGEHYTAIPTQEQLTAAYAQQVVVPASTNTVTIWVESGTAKIPVTLQKQGDKYTGPNGETYTALPTADQLKAIYAPTTEQSEFGVMITKNDGTQTVINLKRQGTNYIGPNGETYTSLPTEDQLKATYGK